MSEFEFGWYALLSCDGETADTEAEARWALALLFPEVPIGADCEPAGDGGAWLVTLPTDVADRVRDGEEYADTAVLVSAGREWLASIVVSPAI